MKKMKQRNRGHLEMTAVIVMSQEEYINSIRLRLRGTQCHYDDKTTRVEMIRQRSNVSRNTTLVSK